MIVLHLIDHYSLGGAQRIVAGLLAAMPDTRLLALRQKGGPDRQAPVVEGQVLLKPRANLLAQAWSWRCIPALLRSSGVEVVHCHLPYSWGFGLWLKRQLPAEGRPAFVFHEHDAISLDRWHYPYLARAAARAGLLVAVSEVVRARILACGVLPEQVASLPNFVDLGRFYPGERTSPPAPPLRGEGSSPPSLEGKGAGGLGPPQIGFAGRLVDYKGWRDFLAAASLLRAEPLRFLIAGDGPDRPQVEQQITRLGLQDRVTLLGYVDDMPAFYRQLDLFVAASRLEAFGLALLEAQACGVPVVSYDLPAFREVAPPDSAVWVESGDATALAAAVRALLGEPARRARLSELGQANARRFGLPAYLERLDLIYRAARASQGAPR